MRKSPIYLVPLLMLLSIAAFGQSPNLPKIEAVDFESKLVGIHLPYNVVLPPDYAAEGSKQTRYPVLYLLHGLFGSGQDWVSDKAHLARHAALYHLIIVTVEGHDGWYVDSITAPADHYESYIVSELIPDVDKRYRTIASREGRAVAGLSMGGYGSLKFGLKFPDKFVFAASMSGALAAPTFDQNEALLPQFVKPSISRAFGPMKSSVREENDIFKIVGKLSNEQRSQLPFLYLDCGTEDGLVATNRNFAQLLTTLSIPHEYRELPGKHEWPYWDQQVQEVLRIANRIFSRAATAGAAAK